MKSPRSTNNHTLGFIRIQIHTSKSAPGTYPHPVADLEHFPGRGGEGGGALRIIIIYTIYHNIYTHVLYIYTFTNFLH